MRANENKLLYNTHFLSSFSVILYQWKDCPPQKPGSPYFVFITGIIWLSKPYTAYDLIWILFRLSRDIGLALQTLKWSLFPIQHAISESHVHFKN